MTPRIVLGEIFECNAILPRLFSCTQTLLSAFSFFSLLCCSLLLAMGAQAPAHTIQLCVGQPWGPNRLAANNLVTIQVRHCKAEQLIERLHQEKWIACEPLITDQMVLDELNEDDLKVQRLLRSATS